MSRHESGCPSGPIIAPETRARLAVGLSERDEWLWDHPAAAAFLDETEALLQPPFVVAACDQHAAAAAELRRTEILNTVLDGRPALGWMRLSVYSAALLWANNESVTCDHLPPTFSARPAFAAAARPEIVMCAECRWALFAGHDDPCGVCGAAGPKGASTLWASHRGFALAFLLCVACHRGQVRELLKVAS